MKQFLMKHIIFGTEEVFDEKTAPDWLTSKNTVKSSTMDNRKFWTDQVLTLKLDSQTIATDFHIIERIR